MNPSKLWQSCNIWERHQRIESEYVKRLTAVYIRRKTLMFRSGIFCLSLWYLKTRGLKYAKV